MSGDADPNAKNKWTPVYEEGSSGNDPVQRTITISSTTADGTGQFDDLPMYQVHENGSVYRIIYAVDEVDYKLYKNGQTDPYKTWSKGTFNHQQAYYSPDYEHDAGELDQPADMADWGEWYTIRLTNVESTREELKNIDLSLKKIWENDNEGAISGASDHYAKFQLKRTYHEEFLDCTNNNLDASDLVTVKLDMKDDRDPMELTVPRGASVYITGMVKDESAVNLAFKRADSADTLSLQYDNSASSNILLAVTNSFAAADNIVWEYQDGDADQLVGGKEGIRLASFDTKNNSFDISEEYDDDAFNKPLSEGGQPAGQEFTLDNSNHWMKDWVDLPQIVEEITVNPETGHTMIKTIVYSYYLVETDSNPSNYTAVFKDDEEYEIGDAQKPVFTSTSITAENVETTEATVMKVWDDDDDSEEMRPDSLTVTLMADGESTGKTVTLTPQNEWTDTISNLPKYDDGEEIDYYWQEGSMPHGYFLTDTSVNGSITTLTNSLSTYDLETEYTGTKTWDDQDNYFMSRPHELQIILYASKALMNSDGTVRTDTDGNIIYGTPEAAPYPISWDTTVTPWVYTFSNLPVFDANGNVIKYSAVETVPGNYAMTEDLVPTTYSLGTIWTDDGKRHLISRETQSILEWQLSSMIDLPFVVIKGTNAQPAYVWSPRIPTPAEKEAVLNFVESLGNGWHVVDPVENTHWYVSATTIENPGHGDVTVEFDPESLLTRLTFETHDTWAQFMIGQFKVPEGEDKYNIGTNDFTNTLTTIDLSGTKTWNIEGVELPADPVLKLTRTVTIVTINGDEISETESEPEEVMVYPDGSPVAVTPVWSDSDTDMSRTYTYEGLPKYDHLGREYHYHVAEVSFTIGSGEDAVTYTVVKNQNGSYTVTADKEGAAAFTVSQTGDNITNAPVLADVEIIKVEQGHRNYAYTLAGAQFQVTKVDENGHEITGAEAYKSEIQTVDSETGKTTFTGLKPGRYMLEEKKAPAGHVLVETPWYFNVDVTGIVHLEAEHTMASNAWHTNSFFIENKPGAALPHTGGHGTRIFTILGAILTAGAGLLLLRRRRAI